MKGALRTTMTIIGTCAIAYLGIQYGKNMALNEINELLQNNNVTRPYKSSITRSESQIVAHLPNNAIEDRLLDNNAEAFKSGNNELYTEAELKSLIDADTLKAREGVVPFYGQPDHLSVKHTLMGMSTGDQFRYDGKIYTLFDRYDIMEGHFLTPVIKVLAADTNKTAAFKQLKLNTNQITIDELTK